MFALLYWYTFLGLILASAYTISWSDIPGIISTLLISELLGNDHLTWRGGYGFFLKKYSDSQCCWKKYYEIPYKSKAQNTEQCKQLLDICQDNCLEQVVNEETHFTEKSKSILDLFFTSEGPTI
jgi:hypothetical protein